MAPQCNKTSAVRAPFSVEDTVYTDVCHSGWEEYINDAHSGLHNIITRMDVREIYLDKSSNKCIDSAPRMQKDIGQKNTCSGGQYIGSRIDSSGA